MSISCDCSVDVDGRADVYREKVQTARKSYKCCECGEEIKPGQKYNYVFGVWEGMPDTYRTCLPCNNIRERYCFHGFYFGNLRDQIRGCLGFDYTEIPAGEEQ